MKAVVKIESRRILRKEILVAFLVVVLFLSVASSYQAVKKYEIWDENGFLASGIQNLRHGKDNAEKQNIEEAIAALREQQKPAFFVDETNIADLVDLNYSDKNVSDLSDKEINLFFEKRLEHIEQRLNESQKFSYTESEKKQFMEKAEELTSLMVGFAEGWKVLNNDMGSFVSTMLVIISIIVMPLFADDPQSRMKELNSSTKNGKKQLDRARIITAFGVGMVLYFVSVGCYFFIKMMPFGFSGGGEYIQSNGDIFFSVYHITYVEMFAWNCMRGYVALIFVISMSILLSVTLERIMAGAVVICFFWGLLFLMEKVISFEVNHLFANFMPLRLVSNNGFYTQNEIYRFVGKTFDSLVWCPAVALFLSGVMVGITVWWLYRKRINKIV